MGMFPVGIALQILVATVIDFLEAIGTPKIPYCIALQANLILLEMEVSETKEKKKVSYICI